MQSKIQLEHLRSWFSSVSKAYLKFGNKNFELIGHPQLIRVVDYNAITINLSNYKDLYKSLSSDNDTRDIALSCEINDTHSILKLACVYSFGFRPIVDSYSKECAAILRLTFFDISYDGEI